MLYNSETFPPSSRVKKPSAADFTGGIQGLAADPPQDAFYEETIRIAKNIFKNRKVLAPLIPRISAGFAVDGYQGLEERMMKIILKRVLAVWRYAA